MVLVVVEKPLRLICLMPEKQSVIFYVGMGARLCWFYCIGRSGLEIANIFISFLLSFPRMSSPDGLSSLFKSLALGEVDTLLCSLFVGLSLSFCLFICHVCVSTSGCLVCNHKAWWFFWPPCFMSVWQPCQTDRQNLSVCLGWAVCGCLLIDFYVEINPVRQRACKRYLPHMQLHCDCIHHVLPWALGTFGAIWAICVTWVIMCS